MPPDARATVKHGPPSTHDSRKLLNQTQAALKQMQQPTRLLDIVNGIDEDALVDDEKKPTTHHRRSQSEGRRHRDVSKPMDRHAPPRGTSLDRKNGTASIHAEVLGKGSESGQPGRPRVVRRSSGKKTLHRDDTFHQGQSPPPPSPPPERSSIKPSPMSVHKVGHLREQVALRRRSRDGLLLQRDGPGAQACREPRPSNAALVRAQPVLSNTMADMPEAGATIPVTAVGSHAASVPNVLVVSPEATPAAVAAMDAVANSSAVFDGARASPPTSAPDTGPASPRFFVKLASGKLAPGKIVWCARGKAVVVAVAGGDGRGGGDDADEASHPRYFVRLATGELEARGGGGGGGGGGIESGSGASGCGASSSVAAPAATPAVPRAAGKPVVPVVSRRRATPALTPVAPLVPPQVTTLAAELAADLPFLGAKHRVPPLTPTTTPPPAAGTFFQSMDSGSTGSTSFSDPGSPGTSFVSDGSNERLVPCPAFEGLPDLGPELRDHIACVAPGLFIGDIEAAVSAEMLTAAGITHIVDLSNSFVDDCQPRDALGILARNVSYEVPRVVGEWRASCPMVEAKLVVRVDDVDGAPLNDHFAAITAFCAKALAHRRNAPAGDISAGGAGGAGVAVVSAAEVSVREALDDEAEAWERKVPAASSEEASALSGSGGGGVSGGAVLVHCFRGKSRSACAVVQYLMTAHGLTLRAALAATKHARPCININATFRAQLMALEASLRPGEPPSIVLSLRDRRPTLTSASRRPSSRGRRGSSPAFSRLASSSGGSSPGGSFGDADIASRASTPRSPQSNAVAEEEGPVEAAADADKAKAKAESPAEAFEARAVAKGRPYGPEAN